MKLGLLAISLLLSTFCATIGYADVVGTFDVGGSTATVSSTSIDFDCTIPSTVIPGSCPSSDGNGLVNNATGDMTPFFLEGAFIQDLTFPLNTPIDVPNWIVIVPTVFNGTPGPVSFELTFLPLGVFSSAQCAAPAAPGETCTPLGSNFNLVNTTSGFTASFDVDGTAHLADGSLGTFTGTFTSTVNGENFQDALATIASGGTVTETYGASFTIFQAVPEPSYAIIPAFLALTVPLILRGHFKKQRKRKTS